jgi:hypothetical protein
MLDEWVIEIDEVERVESSDDAGADRTAPTSADHDGGSEDGARTGSTLSDLWARLDRRLAREITTDWMIDRDEER